MIRFDSPTGIMDQREDGDYCSYFDVIQLEARIRELEAENEQLKAELEKR